MLDGSPELESVESARTIQADFVESPRSRIGLCYVLASEISRVLAKGAAKQMGVASEQSTQRERYEHPFVRIESNRISLLDALQLLLEAF